MDFKQLQSFVAVVENGSFTKAAESLYISQPTISTHIHQLEEELNTRLVIRTTKNLNITPKGKEIYEYSLKILQLKQRIIESCSSKEDCILHLGASTIPSAYILPGLLPRFGKLYPKNYFIIHQSDSQGVIEKLKDRVFDICMVGMPVEEEELECKAFCQDRMIIITPVNEHYLSLKEGDIDLRALLQEPIIMRENGSGSKKSAARLLERLQISEDEMNIAARINDQEAIKNLVAEGVGISIISQRAAQNFIDEKRIIAIDLPEELAGRQLYLVYRKSSLMKNNVKEFIRFILEEMV